ncbi:MAG: peptidoglycan-associated lipoprotein Pal [Zoogloeaceae bacterium]|jgi:peptidoglycan-associated lipoprotein|nr:peptidoglycan-associated lipoprotein Pal [Zoogloeaceae bacterium]
MKFSAKTLFAVLFLALALLGGCGTTNPTAEAPVESRAPVTGTSRPLPPDPIAETGLPADLANISRRRVYFALDRYDIAEQYRPVISANARYLTQNRQVKVLIQGNTDERGSREYNLSLGQKRAEAVRQALLLLGVQENQIEAVSLGEEKPLVEGHNEEAWAQNRRADILYPGEY